MSKIIVNRTPRSCRDCPLADFREARCSVSDNFPRCIRRFTSLDKLLEDKGLILSERATKPSEGI